MKTILATALLLVASQANAASYQAVCNGELRYVSYSEGNKYLPISFSQTVSMGESSDVLFIKGFDSYSNVSVKLSLTDSEVSLKLQYGTRPDSTVTVPLSETLTSFKSEYEGPGGSGLSDTSISCTLTLNP